MRLYANFSDCSMGDRWNPEFSATEAYSRAENSVRGFAGYAAPTCAIENAPMLSSAFFRCKSCQSQIFHEAPIPSNGRQRSQLHLQPLHTPHKRSVFSPSKPLRTTAGVLTLIAAHPLYLRYPHNHQCRHKRSPLKSYDPSDSRVYIRR